MSHPPPPTLSLTVPHSAEEWTGWFRKQASNLWCRHNKIWSISCMLLFFVLCKTTFHFLQLLLEVLGRGCHIPSCKTWPFRNKKRGEISVSDYCVVVHKHNLSILALKNILHFGTKPVNVNCKRGQNQVLGKAVYVAWISEPVFAFPCWIWKEYIEQPWRSDRRYCKHHPISLLQK